MPNVQKVSSEAMFDERIVNNVVNFNVIIFVDKFALLPKVVI